MVSRLSDILYWFRDQINLFVHRVFSFIYVKFYEPHTFLGFVVSRDNVVNCRSYKTAVCSNYAMREGYSVSVISVITVCQL